MRGEGELAGKVLFIAGAGPMMGAATARMAAREGARVIATDRDLHLLQGLEMECLPLDVTDAQAVLALRDRLPKLDGLFNCAGYVANGTVLDVTDRDWDFSFNLNVKSMLYTCRSFIPGMLERAQETGTASILNMIASQHVDHVYLDCRHMDMETLGEHFPTFLRTCAELGYDPRYDRIPIRPAAHYQCGGIEADINGATCLDGIYAIGECARTGMHGANRLASNSLLEAGVMALRCAEDIARSSLRSE